MGRGRKIHSEKVREAAALYYAGMTYTDIGAKLGVTNITVQKWSQLPAWIDTVNELRKQRENTFKIADKEKYGQQLAEYQAVVRTTSNSKLENVRRINLLVGKVLDGDTIAREQMEKLPRIMPNLIRAATDMETSAHRAMELSLGISEILQKVVGDEPAPTEEFSEIDDDLN